VIFIGANVSVLDQCLITLPIRITAYNLTLCSLIVSYNKPDMNLDYYTIIRCRFNDIECFDNLWRLKADSPYCSIQINETNSIQIYGNDFAETLLIM